MKFGRISLAAVAAISLIGIPSIAAAVQDTEKIEAAASETFASESVTDIAVPANRAPAEVVVFNQRDQADPPIFLADLKSNVPGVAAATFAALPAMADVDRLVAVDRYRALDTT